MKINELTGYKSNPLYKQASQFTSQRDDFFNREPGKLEDIMKQHGFQHVGTGFFGTVYKHPNSSWLFKLFQFDETYKEYFQYMKTHQNNPHVPKIKGGLIKLPNDAYVAQIEPLTEINDQQWAEFEKIRQTIEKLSNKKLMLPNQILFMRKHQQLAKLLNELPGQDLNRRNIMMRNGTFVIIDC